MVAPCLSVALSRLERPHGTTGFEIQGPRKLDTTLADSGPCHTVAPGDFRHRIAAAGEAGHKGEAFEGQSGIVMANQFADKAPQKVVVTFPLHFIGLGDCSRFLGIYFNFEGRTACQIRLRGVTVEDWPSAWPRASRGEPCPIP